jgi:hypothetical protein
MRAEPYRIGHSSLDWRQEAGEREYMELKKWGV